MDQKFRDRFAQVILELRGNEPQRSFSQRLGISQASVSAWERGSLPTIDSFVKIATLRGQYPEEFMAELYDRNPTDVGIVDRAEIMTKTQLIESLEVLVTKLKQKELEAH
jgi:transcriptional regulator with XRE-family HTH domain